MSRVEAEVDEEGNRHSKLEPLHHIGGLLAVQGRGHVTPQDHALSSVRRHKPGFLSHTVGTWGDRDADLSQYEQGILINISMRPELDERESGAQENPFAQDSSRKISKISLHPRLIYKQ